MKEIRCRLPWLGFAFSEKQYSPCVSYDENWEDWKDFDFNNEKFCRIRKKIYNNDLDDMPICTRCTRNKDKAGYFDYEVFDEIYKKNMENYNPESGRIENYDLGFIEYLFTTNCNLACRMCGKNSSSYNTSLSDVSSVICNRKQKEFVNSSNMSKFSEFIKLNPANVALLGGEIFIENDSLDLLKQVPLDTSIFLFTNGTICKPEMVEELNKHKGSQLVFSIDNADTINDYIRIGSKYDVIIDNLKKYREIFDGTIVMHSAVSIYSALYLDELIESIMKLDRYLDINCFTIVNNPPELSVGIMPNELKNKIFSDIAMLDNRVKDSELIGERKKDDIKRLFEGLMNEMIYSEYDEDKWNALKEYTLEVDGVYGFDSNIFFNKVKEVVGDDM